jgi:hypothetical protein
MKKLLTVVFTMLLAGSLAFAQTGGGSTDAKTPTKTASKKGKTKAHKGGKKSKKGTTTTTPAPK